MKRTMSFLAVFALAATAGLAACSGNTGGTTGGDTTSGAGNYVIDGTVTMSQVSDPGALDPQMSIVSGVFDMTFYAYDSIVGIDPTGKVLSQLAKSWTYEGTTAVFTLNSGITCSDGSALTAQTVADNITWLEDPTNASPFLGTFLPVGITAAADTTANTVTLTLAQPAPFLLQTLANVPIVCDAALHNRDQLQAATLGSGPYQLTEAVPNDHYTYTRRDGYTWGPDGATTATPGLPKTIVVKIVPNESTEVNLLLSGDVNVATTVGPDAERARAAGLASIPVPAILGLTWYNHADGHPTSDPAVRQALTQAVDFDQLAKVITGNVGSRATQLAVIPPAPCNFDAVTGNLPTYDSAAAGATLEAAGYTKGADGMYAKNGQPLTVSFLYDSTLATAGQSAAELAMQQWQAAGITVQMNSYDSAQMSGILFGTGDWDMVWEPINVNSPDQMTSFLSGPGVADGGANFSLIDNADYTAGITQAFTQTGDAACSAFQTAESALYKASDIVAWAVRPNDIFLNKVEYVYVGKTQVTSLRVLAS